MLDAGGEQAVGVFLVHLAVEVGVDGMRTWAGRSTSS